MSRARNRGDSGTNSRNRARFRTFSRNQAESRTASRAARNQAESRTASRPIRPAPAECFKKESLLAVAARLSYSHHVRQPRANSPRPLNY